MGKEHFVAFGVEEGGIGHECVLTRETLAEQHGEDGLEVALATCHDALVVEQGQGQTTCRMGGRNECKTLNSKGIQMSLLGHFLQGAIQTHGLDDILSVGFTARLCPLQESIDGGQEVIGDGLFLEILHHLLEVEVDILHTPHLASSGITYSAGNQPVGGFANQTDTQSRQLLALLQHPQLGKDDLHRTMQDGTCLSLLAYPTTQFHRGCQRIGLAIGQENERMCQLLVTAHHHALGTTRCDEKQRHLLGLGTEGRQLLLEDDLDVIMSTERIEQLAMRLTDSLLRLLLKDGGKGDKIQRSHGNNI